jgi:ketosteroid isomerase-like protein
MASKGQMTQTLCGRDKLNMEEFFQKYTEAFDSLDANAIADLYMLPCSASDGDGANVFSNRESLVEKFSGNCTSMKGMGYKHSKFSILDVTDMGGIAKAVVIGWRVFTTGSEFEFRTLYVCHNINGAWRVFSANVYQGSFSNVT